MTGPVKLGNPGEFTMIELAEVVRELTGSSSPLVRAPLPQDDPRQRQPDITLRLLEAIRFLGLERKTRFYQASTSDL